MFLLELLEGPQRGVLSSGSYPSCLSAPQDRHKSLNKTAWGSSSRLVRQQF